MGRVQHDPAVALEPRRSEAPRAPLDSVDRGSRTCNRIRSVVTVNLWTRRRAPYITGRSERGIAQEGHGNQPSRIGREDVDECFGPASVGLAWCGRRVGGLGPGLTCESADAAGCLANRSVGRVPGFFGTHRRCRSDLPGLGKRPGFTARRPAGACHPSTTKGMAMTIVEDARAITGGVDTHADMHVAAALDPIGGLLGVQEFPATPAGYARLLGWLRASGPCAWSGSRAPAATAPGWPVTWPRPASGSSRWTVRTGRTAAARASPIPWTRSARPAPPCPGERRVHPEAGTGRWRRSAR